MKIIFLVLLLAIVSVTSCAQESLQQEIRDIAVDAKGQVSAARVNEFETSGHGI
jgi:hypothetical protein